MSSASSLRALIRSTKDRFPRVDGYVWNAERGLRSFASRGARRGASRTSRRAPVGGRAKLLVVAPGGSRTDGLWAPAQGDIAFELFASAKDYVGAEHVDVEFVDRGESTGAWQSRVLDRLVSDPFTHLIAYVEHDPAQSASWHWDLFFARLRRQWSGTAIGLFYDSAHRRHLHMADRLARMYPGTVIVAIDRDSRPFVKRGVVAVGPVFLPVSQATIERVASYVQRRDKEFDVTFIGELYPYRHDVITALRGEGLAIAVNPHRGEAGVRSTYLDYVGAMSRSWMTINFSRCSGPPIERLKSRVLEAGLAGTAVVTDDLGATRTFYRPDEQFLTATTPREFADVCAAALSDRQRLADMSESFRRTSLQIAATSFWSEIDRAAAQGSKSGVSPEPLLRRDVG